MSNKKYLVLEIDNCNQCIYCERFTLTQNWDDFRYYCHHPSFKPIRVYSKLVAWLSETIVEDDDDLEPIDIPKWCPISPDEKVDISRFEQLELQGEDNG